ncbi:MAG: hypothetical protein K2X27_12540, partial [Candidatus Obscuribacterales bacterium]|nr:hypothetical protein [Candidatus Obscuribacterales bacterium]
LHQLIAGLGTYLYCRDLKGSRAAAMFAATAVSLCAYNFSFVRNCTLPASMAWLPLCLFFERRINSRAGKHELGYMLGLAFAVSMLMHVGRPEVGAPEMLLIGFFCVSKPLLFILNPKTESAEWRACFFKLASLVLGLALSMPTVLPGVEWTALSPRAQGMASKYVFLWSANWYDFLGTLLPQPMGDLYHLDNQMAKIRTLVLSRGGYLPFLSSAYLSAVVYCAAFWGLFDKDRKFKITVLVLLAGFVLMAAGNYTPFAPNLVSLSPFLSTFRYPVKLLFFPCMLVTLLAVRGFDLMLKRELSQRLLMGTLAFWGLAVVAAFAMLLAPDMLVGISKWKWLWRSPITQAGILLDTQRLFAGSIFYTACLGILCSVAAELRRRSKLGSKECTAIFVILLAGTLVHCAATYRNGSPYGFYNKPSVLADNLKQRMKALDGNLYKHRILNLYFDPLKVPDTFKCDAHSTDEEDFFQYSRQMLLYQSVLDWEMPTSNGYEAAETADYNTCFKQALKSCSLFPERRKKLSTGTDAAQIEAAESDAPVHRYASLTASAFINSQIYKMREDKPLPKLDAKYFELLEENKAMNYRTYKTLNVRPRFYFTDDLVYLESFQDMQKMLSSTDDVPQTRAIDESMQISYVLNRDHEKHKAQFDEIERMKGSSDKRVSSVDLDADNGQELSLTLRTQTPALLVLADHFYPGWVAELDGKEVEILKVNMLNQGVLVPPGSHKLKVAFKPRSLYAGTIGAALSLMSFLLFYFFLNSLNTRLRKLEQDSPGGA